MTIHDITTALEELAPLPYAEDFDNVGLLIGRPQQEVSGILVTLDTLETTVEEAISKNCNLIISFHPIIFSGLKSLTGKTYVERVAMRALEHGIAIYAVHTALDNVKNGVGKGMCDALGLTDREVLIPKKGNIKKLVTYVPKSDLITVKEALFSAGAGNIGNYDHCSFATKGNGSFKGNASSNPTVGQPGLLQEEKEIQLHITFESHRQRQILAALFRAHSYEEVAYEITALDNENQNVGLGMTGFLKEPLDELTFLHQVQKAFKTQGVRYSQLRDEPINKVAVLGGSGAFAIEHAKRSGADTLVTADLKYHQFFQAENKLLLVDIGHYESEQYTKNILADFLTEKFSNFAVVLSEEDTNPVNYL